MADLLPRVATAAVGLPILIALAFFGPNWTLWLLFAGAAAVGAYEYVSMCLGGRVGAAGWLSVAGTFGVLTAGYWWGGAATYAAAAATMLAILVTETFTTSDIAAAAPRVGSLLSGCAYATVLFGGLLLLVAAEPGRQLEVSPEQAGWLLFPMSVIWAGDTGAYFAGRAFGRRKLAPRLSPKKTWEGALGGAFASVAGGWLASELLFVEMQLWQVVILALPAALLGQLGDLCESLLKRSTGVKDSGWILYGHGGVLDRVDALVFAAPYFVVARELLDL